MQVSIVVQYTIYNYVTIYLEPHAHLMLTQMNMKQGLQKYRKKGKTLGQLHNKEALMHFNKVACCMLLEGAIAELIVKLALSLYRKYI